MSGSTEWQITGVTLSGIALPATWVGEVKLTLVANTTSAVVVGSIEQAAERNGITLIRVEDDE